jgi:hypothetical protein
VNLLIALAASLVFVHAGPVANLKHQIKRLDLLMLKEQGIKAVEDICMASCYGRVGTCAEEWPSWDLKELTALAENSVSSDFQVKMRSLKVVEKTSLCIGLIEVSSSKNGSAIIRVVYDLFGTSGIRENIDAPAATEADAKAAEEARKAAYAKCLKAKKEAARVAAANEKAEKEAEAEDRTKDEARKKARGPDPVEPPLTVKIPPRLEDNPEFKPLPAYTPAPVPRAPTKEEFKQMLEKEKLEKEKLEKEKAAH